MKIDGRNLLDQLINDDTRRYENRKIATGLGDDYTTSRLLYYPYFKGNYKTFAIYLSKQQARDADLVAIQ